MELIDTNITHEQFFLTKLGPARKRNQKYDKLRITFHKYKVPGSDIWSSEYLVGMKGFQKRIGLDCTNTRRADADDPDRIIKFMYEVATGKLPGFAWYYLRSFAELVRVAQGISAPVKPEQKREFEADRKLVANDHLRIEYDRGLAFSEDIEAVSKRHDELFRDKIMGEKEKLEILGPDGKGLDVAKSLSKKLEQP